MLVSIEETVDVGQQSLKMTSGSDSSNGTARTADERKTPVAGLTNHCTCQQNDDVFMCPKCQNAQFARQVKDKDVSVGGVDCKTRLVERINGGSFGDIYLGTILDNGEEVAVKIERQDSSSQQLLYEGNVYRKLEGGPGIPKVHWFGMHGTQYNALVMDLMGPSLQELFKNCHLNFSLKTVLLLIDQIIDVIEYVHCQNFVHRDISPNNFMVGRGQNGNTIYLIDYGHAKKYSTGHQIRPSRNVIKLSCSLVGTPRFASFHAHQGHEPARRDDAEAIAYMLVYLMKGKLPWQGLQMENMQEKLRKIGEVKMNTASRVLCAGLPDEFAVFLEHTRKLGRHDPPHYSGIKALFRALARKNNYQYDNGFDWNVKHNPLPEVPVDERPSS